ncbi:MAG: glycosyltransferase, partial [Clostridia bacterium]|nr:glycosyltransferase [Clostridia bacterium]
NGYLSRIKKVVSYLKKESPQVLITFLEVPNFLGCLSRFLGAKFKLITTECSSKDSSFEGRNRIFNFFERYADFKVCNSENAKKKWEKHFPEFKNKLRVIYNPVIVENNHTNYSIRCNGKTEIVVAASYQGLKNPLGMIEAVNILSDQEKKKLIIRWYGRKEITDGDSSVFERSIEQIEKYNLQNTIYLYPETKEIHNKMIEADAVALFSTVEGLPNSICEALVLGKPIIMSRVSDYEVLVNGNGFSFDPESNEDIANSIRKLIQTSDNELVKMGDQSKMIANHYFKTEKIVAEWSNLFN